jgi:DNA-binding NarL/FixJ family response regulator
VVLDGLRRIVEVEPRLTIVAEARSAGSAIEAARRHQPDVILMDVRLPDEDGITACRRIKECLPSTRVLFLTSFADNQFVLAAMKAGGDGYLLKESDSHRIIAAIDAILAGGTVFDPVGGQGSLDPRRQPRENPLANLALRELRVLAEVAKGKTDKEVATALNLTTKTARNYLDRTFAKLNVHTRTEAAMLYSRYSDDLPS